LAPAVGVVDGMRVSMDVAPRWDVERPVAVPGFEESESGARNAIRASILRAPLHRRLWLNDPDCVLLRRSDTTLTDVQRAVLVDVVAGTGGLAMVSDELAGYGPEEWQTAARLRDGAVGPLDIVDPFASTVTVRSASSELAVDWHSSGESRLTRHPAPGYRPRPSGGSHHPGSRTS
jgi:hypothetical protein